MASTTLVPLFKDGEALKNFFTERFAIQNAFNQKVEDLKKESEQILKDNKEKVLYSIPFTSETYVFLTVDAMNNFYHQFKHLYSKENGILLKEIQIVCREYSSDFILTSSCIIKFIFGINEFNNHWASFSLDRLYCDDKDFELSDQSMGPCLDPKFIDPQKYFLVKGFITEVRSVFSQIEKEKAEVETVKN